MEFKKLQIQPTHSRKKKGFLRRSWPLIIVAGFLILIAYIFLFGSSTSNSFNFGIPKALGGPSIKSSDDRVNILLLGNAGGTHDGPSLTDSIIVASYHLKTNNVVLISIPRDLWVDSTKSKINAVYEKEERNGDGLKFAEEKIGEIVGLPIHYGVRLDFNGFAKAIDLVEGVDVEVPKTFDDYNYPIEGFEDDLCGYKEEERDLTEDQIKSFNLPTPLPSNSPLFNKDQPVVPGKRKVLIDPSGQIATASANFGCRYEHIFFKKGTVHMDGITALKFVRSRMGTNGEGSDFARSRRQQLVLQAFRSKALSLETLVNPAKVGGLIITFGDSIETNIGVDDYLEFYNLSKKVKQTKSLVLGDLGDGRSVLITPPPQDYGGAFVLIPKDENFDEIRNFIKDELAKSADPGSLPSAGP